MSKIKLSKEFIKSTVKLALNEDLYPSGDITSSLINKDNNIVASKVYAKHDENYMPASIKKELEKNNLWKKDYK